MDKKMDFIERFSSSITEPAFKDCSFGKDVKEISISIILKHVRDLKNGINPAALVLQNC